MCAGGWTDVEAGVVCRMMGHSGGHSLPGLSHSLASPPRLAEVRCRGWETNILQCDHLEISDQCPGGQGDAGVTCFDDQGHRGGAPGVPGQVENGVINDLMDIFHLIWPISDGRGEDPGMVEDGVKFDLMDIFRLIWPGP